MLKVLKLLFIVVWQEDKAAAIKIRETEQESIGKFLS
ncbi:hypothetical protein BCO_0900090 (plasmid) [Borrelia coriaceae ATCC 43381]|uniref:Uncharacterized protein n=1 Tax=Borrelia coriaceae ATCC 43381 TaxID=1408429 RepID=W5SX74_9SPIR|nr:hypothetical protein BCO_0900090 [Borrelia coriaceae ATCC 43381]